MYLKTANNAAAKYGEERADTIAWKAVSSRFEKVNDKFVAKSDAFVREVYIFKPKQIQSPIVVKSMGGDLLFEGVLATSNTDKKGERFSKELLKTFAEQGNRLVIKGDVDHKYLNHLRLKYGDDYQAIARELKNRESKIKASRFDYVEKDGVGQLMLKALVDKNHKDLINNYNFLSIEAVCDKTGSEYTDGNLIGFTLTNDPVNPSCAIAA